MTASKKAGTGAIAWIVFAIATVPNLHHGAWARALLVLAALVLVPLALELIGGERDAGAPPRLMRAIRAAQFPAALLLACSCFLAAGKGAAALAVPWVGVCSALAAAGVLRARSGMWRRPLDRLCVDAALLFIGIGGGWTLADRAGFRPLNFDEAIVALTAVHFHFAGLLLPIMAGLTVRVYPDSRAAARAAVGVVLGVPAVAVGITATQLGWGPACEAAAGWGLGASGLVIALFHVRFALERGATPLTRVLFFIAGASLFFAMLLAVLYASRAFAAPLPWLDVPWMRALHGTANALGFGGGGLLAWRNVVLQNPPGRETPSGGKR